MKIDPRLKEIRDCMYRISVKAIIIKDGRLLLVKEEDDEWWSLPGGGIDYGESELEALHRELAEELGVSPDTVKTDGKIAFVAVGAVVDGVPRANLFYRVDVPVNTIKPTKYVIESTWFSAVQLPDLFMSPSTGSISRQLIEIMNTQHFIKKS